MPGDAMSGSYLGPVYEQKDIEERLRKVGAVFTTLDDEGLIHATADALARGCAVGWHQGRMEFGPRALGGRSILADPRSPAVQKQLNLKVKFRESFRPFAPSVLREDVQEWFQIDVDSPYMLMVADVAREKQTPMTEEQQKLFGIDKLNVPRSSIPAITHVDYSARVQTVDRTDNPRYYDLIKAFEAKTGYGVIINTSFNVRGEPIVCTPEDAYRCFMRTEMDYLVLGSFLLDKKNQPVWNEKKNWKEDYVLD